jgi:filamentous hemagglutinin family protein
MARRWHHAVLTASALLPLAAATALAGPNGANVVGGNAAVRGQGTANVIVNQSTQNAIINWQTFNIGTGETTRIYMPNSGSTQLDRVTGGQGPSQILGTLFSNGKVFLVNPDGILFGMGSRINVGGLVATTNDITNKNFMAGRYKFNIPGNPNASIVNMGTITAQTGGFAALVAPGVRNTGTITARLGTIALASGNAFTLDMYGDNLITLGLTDSISSQVVDISTGQPLKSLVSNEGKLKANGGTVTLTAAAARAVVDSVINNSGVIEANSIGSHNGMIVLGAATAGGKPAGTPIQTVTLSGKLSARGKRKGTTGGTIIVTGENVAVAGATIDASGQAGGGTVLIGGDWGGGHPNTSLSAGNASAMLQPYAVPNANTVSIDAATTIDTSATQTGNGGKAIVWANQATTFLGTILAKGGAQSGNGGFVETSGGALTFSGAVSTAAPNGNTGIWLLDPTDLIIDANGAATISSGLANNNIVVYTNSDGSTSGQGVTSSGVGDIIVASGISWSSGNTLTLSAYNSIDINASISAANGGLTLNANNAMSATAPVTVGTFTLQNGAWSQVGSLPAFSANNFAIRGGSFLRASGGDGSSVNPYQIADIYGLQGIGSSATLLADNYILANAIDASGTANWNSAGFVPIGNPQDPFSGSLNGQGFAINNLTIKSSAAYVGLFGTIAPSGSAQNLGIASINLTAEGWNGPGDYAHVGALAAINYGTITNSYATGVISSDSLYGTAGDIGGLVGTNYGSIGQSYANVNLTESSQGGALYLGGLVGWNEAGTVTQSYATGTVNNTQAQYADVGGLIGLNTGTVSQSYSIGAVSGLGSLGGLIGVNSGTVTSSYWDTQTTGQNESAGGNGLTTPQFQTGLPSGFDATAWAINSNINGGYPYLLWELGGAAQAVSGYVYNDAGITIGGGGIAVSGLVNGLSVGMVTTGANGSYNIVLSRDTISSSGSQVLTYTSAGAAYLQNATGSIQNLNIYQGYLNETTGASNLSAVSAGLATAIGGNGSVQTLINGLTNRTINALGVNFAIDQQINAATLLLSSTGAVTQSAPLTVTNLALLGGSGSFLLNNGANQIATLAANAGSVSLTDTTNLNVGTVVGASGVSAPGALTLSVNGSIGATGAVNVGTFTLANGNWIQNSASLPGFTAQNFVIGGGSFLRVAGGNGTTAPFQITDAYGLQGIGSSAALLADSYVLANSIDASGTGNWNGGAGFVPIGNGTLKFTGTFNGNGDTISGLSIAPANSNLTTIGLFGIIGSGGTVENVVLNNISVTANPNAGSSGQSIGALTGQNFGTVKNVSVGGTSSVNGGAVVNIQLGGLVGQNDPGALITNSQAFAAVTSTANLPNSNGNCSSGGMCGYAEVGGFVGVNYGSISGTTWTTLPTGCVAGGGFACADGNVSIGSLGQGGGFVGYNEGIIKYAFATGAVTGAAGLPSTDGQAFNNLTAIGGFAGDNHGQIFNSTAAGSVGSAGTMWLAAGGFAANNEGIITSSSTTGPVTTGGNSTAGGFVASNSPGSGTQGFAGDGFNNGATISNSQASGNVTVGASSVAGGFAATGSDDQGPSGGSFTNVTAFGAVSTGQDSIVGGLIGVLLEGGTIANSSARNSLVASAGPNSIVGGVVGLNEGTISGTTSLAPVSGTSDSYIGGITGINLGLVTSSSIDPDISGTGGDNFIGGIAGLNTGSINNSTATIALSTGPSSYSGGVAGVNGSFSNSSGTIANSSFPKGTITNSSATGSGFGSQIGTSTPSQSPQLPSWLTGCTDAGCSILAGGTLQTGFGNSGSNSNITSNGNSNGSGNSNTDSVPASTISVNQQVTQFIQPVSLTGPATPPPVINPANLTTGGAAATGNNANGAGNPTNAANTTGGGSLASGSRGGNGAPPGMRLIDMPVLPLPPGSGLPPTGETRFLLNEVVLQFGPEVTPQQVADIARHLGLTIVSQQAIPTLHRTVYTFRITRGQSVAEVIRAVQNAGLHVAAQPNYTYGLSQGQRVSAADLGDPAQYIVQKLQLGAVHRITQGTDIVVAVIDSRVDTRQPDFAGRIVDYYDAGCGADAPPDVHGTGMAGAIASHIGLLGVAPNARIIAICAFGGTGKPEATSTKIIRGVDYAIAHGAKIINMSFAGPRDPALAQELQIAREKGILIIAAAGNAGPRSPPLYPGADPNVMAVTATDEHDRLFAGANQGSYVTVAAPGVNILVPAPNGDVQFTTGTSVASANVSGVAALLLAEKPTRTPEEIRAILVDTAKHLGPKGVNPQFGAGLVDPLKALRFVPPALGRNSAAAAPLQLH